MKELMKTGLALCLCALAAMSCLKDLGNYEYEDLLEPEITGIPEEVVLKEDRHLYLAPGLGDEVFLSGTCTFEWKAVSGNGETTVLGTDAVLDTEVTLVPGSYTLIFRVTEKDSGIFWQQKAGLRISDVTSEGWMVLCEEGPDRRARLDMYSQVSSRVIKDVLRNNGMPDLHRPYRISWMTGNLVDKESPFYLTTAEGCTRLAKNGFGWKEEYRLVYEMGKSGSPAPVSVCEVVNGKVICDGEKTWYSDCLVSTGLFAEVSPALEIAPVVGTNLVNHNIFIPMSIFYDVKGKRFMGYAPNLRDDLMGGAEPLHEMNEMVELLEHLSNAGDITGNAFRDFPTGMDYVWMENTCYDPNKTGTGMTYAVLRDGAQLHLYGMQTGELLGGSDFSGPAFAIGRAYHADITSCPEIGEARLFAFSSLNGYMYYAVGGKVYRAELADPEHIRTTLQFELPEGERIKVLKFNLYRDADLQTRNYDLVVGSSAGGDGTLRIYEGFSNEGDFRETRPKMYRGFGEIVDVCYRESLI